MPPTPDDLFCNAKSLYMYFRNQFPNSRLFLQMPVFYNLSNQKLYYISTCFSLNFHILSINIFLFLSTIISSMNCFYFNPLTFFHKKPRIVHTNVYSSKCTTNAGRIMVRIVTGLPCPHSYPPAYIIDALFSRLPGDRSQ